MDWPGRHRVFLKPKRYDVRKVKLPLFMEEKHDGHRILLVKKDDVVHAYTTTIGVDLVRDKHNFIEALPDWVKDMPDMTAVETEMVWPEHPASDVPTAVKSHRDKLVFIPFAMPFYCGGNLTSTRYEPTINLIEKVTGYRIRYTECLRLPSTKRLVKLAKRNGYEGFVLKQAGYAGWWKVKVVHTLDLRLVGFKDGQGKYEGEVGAMELEDVNGVHIFCSGMDDATRFSLGTTDLGRIVEVKHNGVTSKGKLRHPRFIRWRDDKETADAIK